MWLHEGGHPVGVLTERDIVTKVASQDLKPSQILVEKIMSHPIISVEPEMIIVEAATLMSAYNIRRLVVVGKDGKSCGNSDCNRYCLMACKK